MSAAGRSGASIFTQSPAPAGSVRGAPIPANEGEQRLFPTWSLWPRLRLHEGRAKAGRRGGLRPRAPRPFPPPSSPPRTPENAWRGLRERPPGPGPPGYLRGRPRSVGSAAAGTTSSTALRPLPRAARPLGVSRPPAGYTVRPLTDGGGAYGRRRCRRTTFPTRAASPGGRHVPGRRGSAPGGPPERVGRGTRVPP
jgi:hypothetical protein